MFWDIFKAWMLVAVGIAVVTIAGAFAGSMPVLYWAGTLAWAWLICGVIGFGVPVLTIIGHSAFKRGD
jgi:hypothetical protein